MTYLGNFIPGASIGLCIASDGLPGSHGHVRHIHLSPMLGLLAASDSADGWTRGVYPAATVRAVARGVRIITEPRVGRRRRSAYPPGVQRSRADRHRSHASLP